MSKLQDLQIVYDWVEIKLKAAQSAVYVRHSNLNRVAKVDESSEEQESYKRMLLLHNAVSDAMSEEVENFLKENNIYGI